MGTRLALLALVLATLPLAGAEAGEKLGPKERAALKKAFFQYVRLADEEARGEMLPDLSRYGRPGIEYLETLPRNDADRSALTDVRRDTKPILGLDLLQLAKTAPPAHDPRSFTPGEIVLARRGDQHAAFAVNTGSKMHEGRIEVDWWVQSKAHKKLTAPGGLSGQVSVEGVRAERTFRPNTGYEEHRYSFEIEGIPIEIRFVGPAFFRIRFSEGGTAFAITGSDKPSKVTAADKEVVFQDQYPASLSRAAMLVSRYIQRTIPGCELLPLEESEREAFEQYEMVQVLPGQTRPAAQPILVVRFLEFKSIGFQPYHAHWVSNFVAEILDLPAGHLFFLAGQARALEGNVLYQDGEWKRPSKKIAASLRRNFPEES